MLGDTLASHSTRAAPPAGWAPSIRCSSVMPRFFMHGVHTQIFPPPAKNLSPSVRQWVSVT
jgi:hypothetical protein